MATLLEKWRKEAYSQEGDQSAMQQFWAFYFELEKGIYAQLLQNPEEKVEGSVKELAKKYKVKILEMTGFLDGINDSLIEKNPIEEMTSDTVVSLAYDKEVLYKNMVGAGADWLYELPEWDALIDEERRKELYKEQKLSTTVRKEKKVGRNDPCPCGSKQKYKKCCGK
jgi:Predicted metal-binding protein related to the C-terminal domain of SecA